MSKKLNNRQKNERSRDRELDAWASGDLDREAAVWLLTHALGGRLAEPTCPWVRVEDDGWTWVDVDRLVPTGVESGGEQRIMAAAHSFLTGAPVSLSWITSSLDDEAANALVRAVAIAAGAALMH